MKPILFNTEMVQAILEGRKTVTRRVIKRLPERTYRIEQNEKNIFEAHYNGAIHHIFTHGVREIKPPYAAGDILYVRETWCKGAISCGEETYGQDAIYVSQCEGEDDYILKAHALHENIGIEDVVWKPSIHMPKAAARIFLKVTDVKVERLQDAFGITSEGIKEGVSTDFAFKELWNSTVNKNDAHKYGWDANPYVWVIEFEQISKEEAEHGETN